MFYVFSRTWWRYNPDWPGGLEPHKGRKTWLNGRRPFTTEAAARSFCVKWNKTHKPGKWSRKAEYTDRRPRHADRRRLALCGPGTHGESGPVEHFGRAGQSLRPGIF
jgi:hypothetical protein